MNPVYHFIDDFNGKENVSFDGIDKNAGQCVQPVGFYVRDYLHTPVMYANAVDWFTNFTGSVLDGPFTRIANDPNNPNQVPQPGDIIIWGGTLPNSGGAGHIAVFISSFSGGFMSFDSNWGGKYCHEVSHDWSYVLGWLHFNGSSTVQGDKDMVIPDEDNYFARFVKTFHLARGRDPSRAEFRATAVGKTWLPVLEELEDDPEADVTRQKLDIGVLAVQDNWQGQIYALQDQLKTSQSIADQLNQTVTQIQGDDASTKNDLQAALDKIAVLTAQLQTANDKLVDVQKNVVVDQETKKNVSTILTIVQSLKGLVLNLFKKG